MSAICAARNSPRMRGRWRIRCVPTALDEVNRGTMESRVCPGVFLVGEMLDVDGRLGGFNFQWAWSSAFVAARGLARASEGERRDG